MIEKKDLTGQIIASRPNNADTYFSKSVIIVGKHSPTGSWGLVVNKPTEKITLDHIMRQTGILSKKEDKVYIGGPVDTNRVYIVHTLDWTAPTTMQITKDIGVTTDISILAAIAGNEGPALFRTCLGICQWAPKQLDGEYFGQEPWSPADSWVDAPATIEAVFHLNEEDQWIHGIDYITKNNISNWF
jgi:putative transcriptional regulator